MHTCRVGGQCLLCKFPGGLDSIIWCYHILEAHPMEVELQIVLHAGFDVCTVFQPHAQLVLNVIEGEWHGQDRAHVMNGWEQMARG